MFEQLFGKGDAVVMSMDGCVGMLLELFIPEILYHSFRCSYDLVSVVMCSFELTKYAKSNAISHLRISNLLDLHLPPRFKPRQQATIHPNL